MSAASVCRSGGGCGTGLLGHDGLLNLHNSSQQQRQAADRLVGTLTYVQVLQMRAEKCAHMCPKSARGRCAGNQVCYSTVVVKW